MVAIYKDSDCPIAFEIGAKEGNSLADFHALSGITRLAISDG
jgi:hypothetical protein